MLKRKRRKDGINGVLVDGSWINDPSQVKELFFNFYRDKFSHFTGKNMVYPSSRIQKIYEHQMQELASQFTMDEIKEADILKLDIYKFVNEFYEKREILNGFNSSFITMIPKSAFVKGRQILDGLLVVNKVIEWYKKKKKKSMEGLHVAIEDVVDHGLFRALRVGSEEVLISHLFYADDAMLMGEWNEENITNLIVILDCFFLISGLKINLYKSKLYGVGVPMQDIENRAVITRCSSATIPFKYLGLPVGNNMNRSSNWENMIQKVKKKLGTWKICENLSTMVLALDSGWTYGWENGQWRWSWLRNIPNGGRTCQQLQDMQNELQYLELNNQEDAWKWQLAKDGVFSVSCTRKHIDNILLNSGDIATRWNNVVPIKVASCIWDRVFRWLDINRPVFSNIEDIFTWIDSLTIRLNRRKVLDAILVTVLWVIWRYRNNKIFGLVKMNRSNIFDDVVSIVF
ncbi:hypothetical protein Tco_1017474 [Tanacetum coccineum]|uniref:Reverse transcriptase zinc-binding domain-containing protein n=1 Tax=Tanacetum coccineum TaxID=301880 RepID=A0ABQ5FS24_9ASTR